MELLIIRTIFSILSLLWASCYVYISAQRNRALEQRKLHILDDKGPYK
jgi:hypothetical protein